MHSSKAVDVQGKKRLLSADGPKYTTSLQMAAQDCPKYTTSLQMGDVCRRGIAGYPSSPTSLHRVVTGPKHSSFDWAEAQAQCDEENRRRHLQFLQRCRHCDVCNTTYDPEGRWGGCQCAEGSREIQDKSREIQDKSDLGWTRRILAHPRGMRSLGPYETAIADYSSLPACVIVEYANYGTTQCTVRVLKVHQQPGMSTALEMAKTHANGDIEAHNRNYQTSLPKV